MMHAICVGQKVEANVPVT